MKPIEVAIAKYGGAAKMAHRLEVSVPAVYSWRNGSRKIPAELCPTIEADTAVACELLCPGVQWHVLRAAPVAPALTAEQPATAGAA